MTKTGVGLTPAFRLFLIWLIVSAIAFAMQLNRISGTYSPDGFVPVGNDAFYHARRIIDAAQGPSGFYEFDPHIHAPEGSLLVWPWGYDYAMGLLLRVGTELGLAQDPMRFLAYVPPYSVSVSIALVILAACALSLSMPATALLGLCVALSPLTAGMHGIGSIDHHFAEYMTVLALMSSALWWMRRPDSGFAAAATAAVLGFGPAIHNGLFVLQALLLACIGFLWLRGDTVRIRSALVFAAVLLVSTLAVLLPSLPFRLGRFEYYLLSWFHLYVACCTAAFVIAFSWFAPRPRAMLALVAVGLLLSFPLVGDFIHAGSFVGKEAAALQNITEARGVWSHFQERGFQGISRIYSALIFLAPAIWVACAVALFRTRDRRLVMVCLHALLTLPLMLAQFRFQYFGSLALYLPLLTFADRLASRTSRKLPLVLAAVVMAVAYYPAVRYGLSGGGNLGNDIYYRMTRLAMPALAKACREDPGIVLARNNEGHYIRYHTDCSVIANNFLLTDQHFDAVNRVNVMFDMTPEELLASDFPVKYVLTRARGIVLIRGDGSVDLVPREEAAVVSDRLTDALLWSDPADVPRGFRLVQEIRVPGGAYQYARIWKIERHVTP